VVRLGKTDAEHRARLRERLADIVALLTRG
jgi:hypothetical protein